VTVKVAVAGEVPEIVTDEGEMVQLTPKNPVPQDKVIVPANPFNEVIVIVEVPDWPAAVMLTADGFAVME
jgi:hypothetical protein